MYYLYENENIGIKDDGTTITKREIFAGEEIARIPTEMDGYDHVIRSHEHYRENATCYLYGTVKALMDDLKAREADNLERVAWDNLE
jgi:hypothetical protein